MEQPFADAILVVHLIFIVFVVGGQVCILVGAATGWGWVRSFGFRLAHLLAVGFVVLESWVGVICPLTLWEDALRRAAGGGGYGGTFIGYWVGRLIYYRAPDWVFTLTYTLFALIVLGSWFMVRPRRRR